MIVEVIIIITEIQSPTCFKNIYEVHTYYLVNRLLIYNALDNIYMIYNVHTGNFRKEGGALIIQDCRKG